MLHVFSMVFGAKKLISELYMTSNVYVLHSTVQFCAVMYCKVQFYLKTVNYRHATCLLHGFWGKGNVLTHIYILSAQNCTVLCST